LTFFVPYGSFSVENHIGRRDRAAGETALNTKNDVVEDRRAQAERLADKSLAGEALTRAESRLVLSWPDEEILSLLAAVFRVRRAHFGRKVKLNFLVNIQSGLCPEDCSYCSQSKVSDAPIDKYRLMSPDDVVSAAEKALQAKASRLCLVASGRGPSDADVQSVSEAVRRVKDRHPHLEICCCLGLLKDGQAASLQEAGVHAYNHNLNTSERYYGEICSTNTFEDREKTVRRAQVEGLSSCCGALFGMGETAEDVIDVAERLRNLRVDSIPLNFLIPVPGTPLEGREQMTPLKCLKVLCLFRLLCPAAELRIAGGRELHLRHLQAMGLFAANSIFVGHYLTTEGQPPSQDLEMIRDLGFEVIGQEFDSPSPSLSERVAILSKKQPA
jgi:biotin synthase